VPFGTLTSWDKYFHWTGITGATWYYLEVQRADGTPLLLKWYSLAQSCSGLTCVLSPTELPSLSNGNYRWRVQDYGDTYGYGPWTGYANFTLNLP
jgi:hypothetical protein